MDTLIARYTNLEAEVRFSQHPSPLDAAREMQELAARIMLSDD